MAIITMILEERLDMLEKCRPGLRYLFLSPIQRFDFYGIKISRTASNREAESSFEP